MQSNSEVFAQRDDPSLFIQGRSGGTQLLRLDKRDVSKKNVYQRAMPECPDRDTIRFCDSLAALQMLLSNCRWLIFPSFPVVHSVSVLSDFFVGVLHDFDGVITRVYVLVRSIKEFAKQFSAFIR